jgi:hypothetical protein
MDKRGGGRVMEGEKWGDEKEDERDEEEDE